MTRICKWTLVQHSGYGYGGNAGFKYGLETREINNVTDLRKVMKAGGVVFDNYMDAGRAEEELPYKNNSSLYPKVHGTFSDEMIDGLRIYIPVREIVA